MQEIIFKKNILILGAGFGGIKCALELERLFKKRPKLKEKYNIVLMDKNDAHLYTPALYEVATAFKEDAEALDLKKSVCVSVEEILEGKNIKFIQGKIEKIDLSFKKVLLNDGSEWPFEYLILALGSETNYFNIEGLKEHSVGLKSFEDALAVRNKIAEYYKEHCYLNIVVGGGGAAGVEVAGEIIGYLRKLENKYKGRRIEVFLAEASPAGVLPGFDEEIIKKTKERLENLGVKLICGSPLVKVDSSSAYFADGKKIDYGVLIWTGGVKPNRLLDDLCLVKERRGRVELEPTMCCLSASEDLALREKIYAIGDLTCFYDPKTKVPLPGTARIAMSEAKVVAKNIFSDLAYQPKIKYVPAKSFPFVIPIGGKFAVAKVGPFKIFGFSAWILKMLVEFHYFHSILPFGPAFKKWIKGVWIYVKND